MVFLCSVEFGFSPICFFSYLFLFRVYFLVTNDITILPASSICITDCCQKIGPFKTFGEFSITNSLKFGFSLFCRVLLLDLFFRTCFYFVFFRFVSFFLIVIYNWEALSFFQWPTGKLTANHQHFNNWIKHLVGLEWKVVYLNGFSHLNGFEFLVN